MMKSKLLTLTLFLIALTGYACNSGDSRDGGDSTAGMNHNTNTGNNTNSSTRMDHSKMNHSEMKSSANAASAPYDLQFLDTMIAHHQGAVDMAQPAEKKAERAEIKTLAKTIIAEQEKEIAQMKKWRAEWYKDQPSAVNMEMAGMMDSMKDMDMKKLESASGQTYDLEFIKQMIPHHEGAVVMAEEALQKSQKLEIKALANAIIKAQQAEIKQMKDWQTAWSR